MIKLDKCPHCGGEVMLCKLNTMITAVEFSIVCTGCGLETRVYANPMSNCCFDMSKAVNEIVEKWNRRCPKT
jgi:Lar family restriction alleviation protein